MQQYKHRLLRRQIKKYLPEDFDLSLIQNFLNAVEKAYADSDEDLNQLELTLELSSQELFRVNEELRKNVARKTEEAEKLNTQIEHIVNSVKEIIFETDLYGNWTYLNHAWEDITGYTVEEALGTSFLSNIHPEDRELSAAYVMEAYNGNSENNRYTARHITKLGEIRWAEAFLNLNRNKDGEVVGYSGTLNDVTERYHAQQELSKLALVAKKTDNIVVVTDVEGMITWVNEAFSKLTGYEPNEVTGKKPGSFLQGKDTDPKTVKKISEAIKARKSYNGEIYNYDKNGKGYWLSISITPMTNEEGEIEGFIAIELDITSKKENEQKLEEVRETLSFALEGNQYGLWDWNVPENKVVYSDVWKTMLGYRPHELEDTFETWENLVHPEDIENSKKDIEDYLSGRQEFYETEFRMRAKNGLYIWILARGKAVSFLPGNKPLRIIGTHQDITNRKRSEQQLEQYALDLERINSELDKFAYIVSHDLKAPLRAINNLSEWIEEDIEHLLEDENKKQMALLRGRVNRMESLINGILQYSKAGRIKTEKRMVDTNEMVNDILDSLEISDKMAIEKPQKLPRVFTEEVAIQQVFSNLISNALKYNDNAKPILTITFNDIGNSYEFSVSDNGPGIDKQFHEKVFVIFQTLQSRDSHESTGVGLAIVKKIIEDHSGEIRIQSEPGQGSSFIFKWPKA